MIKHNPHTGKHTMWTWLIILDVHDDMTPEQEDALLDAVTEVLDEEQIKTFVEEKLDGFGIDVEVK